MWSGRGARGGHFSRARKPACPARASELWGRPDTLDLLQRAFNGSAGSLLIGALSAHKASKKELAELRRLLDEYEKGTR